jgi:hypothetical protein
MYIWKYEYIISWIYVLQFNLAGTFSSKWKDPDSYKSSEFGRLKRSESRTYLVVRVADPWLTDPDSNPDPTPAPDPAIFVKMATKRDLSNFFCLLLFEATFNIIFQRWKVIKKSQNSRNQGFSYYFSLMIEGSRGGFLPRTNGSGRLKIVRIWLRIRICNTARIDYDGNIVIQSRVLGHSIK